jgi:hypothetical protein
MVQNLRDERHPAIFITEEAYVGEVYVHDWGRIEFNDYERGILSRKGFIYKPGGIETVPVSIMLSPAGLRTFDRAIAGPAKAEAMDRAFGDWVHMKSGEFKSFIERGFTISWLCILFGARAFNFLSHFREFVSSDYQPKTIVLKNQRKESATEASGWEIACWGYAPDFDTTKPLKPMTEGEKKRYPFMSKEDIIKTRGIDYFASDVMIISEGAGASGETIETTLVDIFETLGRHDAPLPKYLYIYINFGSTLTALRAAKVCEHYGVELSFTFMGSAINVSPEGLLPGLPYTDLSHLDPGSITYRKLYETGLTICTDLDGNPVLTRCSCGDVGDSLDNPSHYYLLLVLENLILRIPLHRENLARFYRDPEFLRLLRKEVEKTERAHGVVLKNTIGEKITDVISWQENSLKKSTRGAGRKPYY